MSKDKDGLLVSNASLAEYNLSLEPRLISARQQLADVYTKAVELQKEYERNMMSIGLYTLTFSQLLYLMLAGCQLFVSSLQNILLQRLSKVLSVMLNAVEKIDWLGESYIQYQ